MFKSWFGRKPPPRPERQLAVAGDPSLPRPPEGPRLPIAYRGPALILTTKFEDITPGELKDAVRRRIPDIDLDSPTPIDPKKLAQHPTVLGFYPESIKVCPSGRMPLLCGVRYTPEVYLEDMAQRSFVTSCWWWPETREVVALTKAHALTVLLGNVDKTPPKERILVELQLAAAALDVLKTATAVVWPDANAMWKPDDFRRDLEQAKGEIPITLTVAVKIGEDTEHVRSDGTPKWFAMTEGLNALGIMEVEWRAFDSDVSNLAPWLLGIAQYLVTNGPIVGDGDSMGSGVPGTMPPVFVRHEPSTTVLGTKAYVVYPQSPN